MHCRLSRQAVLDEVIAGIEARVGHPEMSPIEPYRCTLHLRRGWRHERLFDRFFLLFRRPDRADLRLAALQ